jgi:hypothetical protein
MLQLDSLLFPLVFLPEALHKWLEGGYGLSAKLSDEAYDCKLEVLKLSRGCSDSEDPVDYLLAAGKGMRL